jgi:pimeloyl-ACP methyl ester carboxylesterase
VSRYRRRLPARDQLGASGTLDGILAWVTLLGVRELPLVLVGHSLGGLMLFSGADKDLGARTWRVAVGPVFPALDWRQRWALRALPVLALALGWVPGMKRLIGSTTFVWSPAARAYAPDERRRMLDAFLNLPLPTLARGMYQMASAQPAPADQLARCAVVLSENDPVAPIGRMLEALRRLDFPEHQIHRLVAEGHVPHGVSKMHPEWTQRNVIELVAIIDQNLAAARDGTVLPTQVASTLMSDGSSTQSR